MLEAATPSATIPPRPYAGFGLRLAAYILDWVVIGVLWLVLLLGLGGVAVAALVALALVAADGSGQIPEAATYALAAVALAEGIAVALVLFLVRLLYYVLFTGLWGWTPGKLLLGLRVVDGEGKVPGIGRALLREFVGKFLSALVLYLGFLWVLWDQQRQGWHDKIAETWVVR